jgi:predicted transposase YbfD/YdcC
MLPNPAPYFANLPDPRRETKNKHFALSEILTIALCAVVSGRDDWKSVADFARDKLPWFRQFLPLEQGAPSHDTFGRVFSLLDPEAFECAFLEWATAATGQRPEPLALDGQCLRRSHRGEAGRALHRVPVWSCTQGLVLAHRAVDEKSNEITALPEVLALFDLSGITVTTDAMGCQKSVAGQIVAQGGDYLLALKGNQGHLHEAVRTFLETRANTEPAHDETVEKEHGRIETRRVWVSDRVDWIDARATFPGLKTLVLVEALREIGGKSAVERRCYLSSLPPEAKRIGQRIRAHWEIENSLHWVLDMAFDEDRSRVRSGHAAETLAIIRRFALNLLKQDNTCSLGIKNKRLKAAYSDAFRLSLLNLSPLCSPSS